VRLGILLRLPLLAQNIEQIQIWWRSEVESQLVFKRSLVLLISILVASGAIADAQQPGGPAAPALLGVHGEATVSVKPDEAQINIGVVTQANTAREAADQNNRRSDALIRGLREAFPAANIKSVNFSVGPNYRYSRGGSPAIAGYTANNTVHLLLKEPSRLPAAIGIAIHAGANSINRLEFTLHNETPVRAQALAEAARQAQAGAEALAGSLNVKLVKLLRVEEAQPVAVTLPPAISFERLQSATLTPISPGTIEVHADVELTYEIAPAGAAHHNGSASPGQR
jgi:uncharacterized protein